MVATAVAWCAAATTGGPATGGALPELVRTKQRTFSIPFRLPKPQDPAAEAAAERVLLQVSKDLGGSWSPAGEASPAATAFSYTADLDGEYWFRLRAVDRKGRMRGGEGPDTRVLVDASGPRLAARVWRGADGEIVCRYSAADDSIDLKSLQVEYRLGAGEWKTVATEGILARQAPAHVVGEDIWWAGEKVEALTVRIAVSDASGNRTTKQFTMESADPGVDQAALAAEVGVPPLPEPGAPASPAAVALPAAATPAPTMPVAPAVPGAWTAEPATWSGGEPRAAADASGRSVLVSRPAPTGPVPNTARPTANAGDASPLLAATGPTPGADGRLEYRGRPLQLSRSRRFAWDYEPPAGASDGRKLRAELWSTRDGGVTWQRTAVDSDGASPIDVEVPAPGLYGFRLEMVATDAPTGGPRSGDVPETWVGVDEEAPHVELLGAARDDAADVLVIRWASRDPLLPPRSARILYSPHADGPWATILDGAENQGEHRWRPDRSVPARVFVRVEVTDAAGNLGTASSPEAVAVSQSRFVGRLGGLKPLPPPEP
ncbi:MAG: hypothetical protein ACKOSQ_06730 [Planctomycetaceae bacterium]